MRPSSGSRLAGIEGLRAIAAGSVLLVHTWGEASTKGVPDLGRIGLHFDDLSYGVVLFFTLSGFLLYRPFVAALLRNDPRPSFTRYLRNRALRILPAYWVILTICALVLGWTFVRHDSELSVGRLSDPVAFAQAALFVYDYHPSTVIIGIGPAWSLAVEVVFYLALPLLVVVAWVLAGRAQRFRRRVAAAFAPALILLVVGLAGKAVAGHVVPGSASSGWSDNWHSVVVRSFFCQADLFTFGMALAVLYSLREQKTLQLPRFWRLAAALGIVASYAAASRVSATGGQLNYSLYNTLMAFACGLLLALVVLPGRSAGKPSLLLRVLETPPLVAAGVISYSVFLWHEPLILGLRDYGLTFDGRAGFFANLALIMLITAVLSTATYLLVEAPALRLKFRRRQSRTEAMPVPVAQAEAAP
jgi:peptidoglycan/LPS O-acetylase OafA/YrhL